MQALPDPADLAAGAEIETLLDASEVISARLIVQIRVSDEILERLGKKAGDRGLSFDRDQPDPLQGFLGKRQGDVSSLIHVFVCNTVSREILTRLARLAGSCTAARTAVVRLRPRAKLGPRTCPPFSRHIYRLDVILHGMATVGERFQVVIERDVRGELGIQPGDRAIETIESGRLVITFLPPRHRRSLRGRLAGAGRVENYALERDRLGEQLARDDAGRRRRDRP